jgi:hypothetical protein
MNQSLKEISLHMKKLWKLEKLQKNYEDNFF